MFKVSDPVRLIETFPEASTIIWDWPKLIVAVAPAAPETRKFPEASIEKVLPPKVIDPEAEGIPEVPDAPDTAKLPDGLTEKVVPEI